MMSIQSTFSIRKILQAKTKLAHQNAEAVHWSNSAFDQLEGYHRFLSCMLRAHVELGLPAASKHRADGARLHEWCMVEQLEHDLVRANDERYSPSYTPRFTRMTIDFAFGVTYALSGSTLGATHILNSGTLDENWPKEHLRAASDFAKRGALARFLSLLEASKPDVRDATAGALSVFEIVADTQKRLWKTALVL